MLEVRPLRSDETVLAADVIAEGMAENPIHVAAWPDPVVRAEALRITFTASLERPCRWALGAFEDAELVGLVRIAPFGSCRPSPSPPRSLTEPLAALGNDALERYLAWQTGWAAHDPEDLHWHFGPFAVLPSARQRGVARSIFERCASLDFLGVVGWLEADREEMAGLYAGYGFEVANQATVLGVSTWFMRRDPR